MLLSRLLRSPTLRHRAPVLLALLGSIDAGQAQPADTTPLPPAAASATALAPVTVSGEAESPVPRRARSATKTDTPLSETPQSVTVVTRQQMQDQGVTSVQDALLYASGVRSSAYGVDSRGDWARVRGADPVQYLDGLQLLFGFNNTPRTDPYALERIDVLRGPASVLYGQGSTAGLINLESKLPQPDAAHEIGLTYGSFQRKQLQADLTGPLTSDGQWLYRLVTVVRESNTQVDFVPDNRFVLAPSLTWKPDARTQLTLLGHWQDDDSGSSATFLPWAGVIRPNVNGQIPTNRFVSEPGFDRYDTTRRSLGWQFEHTLDNDWTVRQNARFTHSTGDYRQLYPLSNFLSPTTPYLDADGAPTVAEGRTVARYMYINERDTRVFTIDQHAEGRLQTGSIEHRVLFGVDASRYSERQASAGGLSTPLDLYAPVYGTFTALTPDALPNTQQRQTGLYVQDQIKLGAHWLLMAGLRHDRATTSVDGEADSNDNATTKRAAVMYRLDGGWTPYLSYSESFLPIAGTNGFNGARFKPLRGQQWEAGAKYAPEGSTLTLNVAVYDLREKNRQVSDAANPNNTLQVGKTTTRGVELEAKQAIGVVDVVGSYTYTDLDRQLEGLPKHQASVWTNAKFSAFGVGGFKAGIGVRWLSDFQDVSAFAPSFAGIDSPTTPSLTLVDALLSYDTSRWRYALNISNITDKVYVSTCLSRGDCWYGARRTVQANATYKF